MKPQLDQKKLDSLMRFDDYLDTHYGRQGSESRTEFESQTRAWYYSEILRQRRKEAHITQQQLADRIGKKRSYIAMLERGETDMQLSTFLMISEALGLRFVLTL